MGLRIGTHLEDTDLELYSMGRLPQSRLAPFEEHFLACDSCQDRLLEMETYINAVRSVSPKLRRESRPRWRERFSQRPTWVAAVVFGMVMLLMGRAWLLAPRPAVVTALFLHASRGIEGLTVAKAPAGKPLTLNIDLTELSAFPAYRIDIVNATGKPVRQIMAIARERRIAQQLPKGLDAGQYYVRLYSAGGELLREFSLQIY